MHIIIKKTRKLLVKAYWHIDKIGDGHISYARVGNRQSCHVTGLPNIMNGSNMAKSRWCHFIHEVHIMNEMDREF